MKGDKFTRNPTKMPMDITVNGINADIPCLTIASGLFCQKSRLQVNNTSLCVLRLDDSSTATMVKSTLILVEVKKWKE